MNGVTGGADGWEEALRCEVAQAAPAGDGDGWHVQADDRQYTVWLHPDVHLPFRQGLQAETYRAVYLPDVPMTLLAGMSIGRERPCGHVEEWLVAPRVLREYHTREATRPYTGARHPPDPERNAALEALLR